MGVTIAYRGSIADMGRVEDFEDRVVDLALEVGGHARIWRSMNDDDPRRMVRGVMLDLYPGQETTSLLVSPEGWLINLFEIEAAEKAEIGEPPWCFVKTQFGPVEGHVALVELLDALKREFFPDLEVSDEGEYWESRDRERLLGKLQFLQRAIDGLAKGLAQYGLNAEAAEDPEILAARIERVAHLVQRTLLRPAEHPPVLWGDHEDEDGFDDFLGGSEAKWDADFKEQRRKQERLQRAMEERRARGEDIGEAFDGALRDEGIVDLPGEDESEPSDEVRELIEEMCETEEDETWRESLTDAADDESSNSRDDSFDFEKEEKHPLRRRARDLMLRLHRLLDADQGHDSFQDILIGGAGEISGGLAQALGSGDWEPPQGLAVVQLKRALRGAAFAMGALFPLRAVGTIDPQSFTELIEALRELQSGIFDELTRIRERRVSSDE